jgi:hypothetical protein
MEILTKIDRLGQRVGLSMPVKEISLKEFNPKEVLEIAENLICTCTEIDCEWHGICRDCVALHRYMSTIPNCLEKAAK